MHEASKPVLSRREMLVNSAAMLAAFAAAGGALSALSGCQTAKDQSPTITTGNVNIGPAANFPAGTANTEFQARYGIVVVNDSGTPLAIRAQCTFAPAPLKWDPAINQFVCSAHGCRFDLLGRVTHGPATRDLAGVVAQPQANSTLTVDLSKLYGM